MHQTNDSATATTEPFEALGRLGRAGLYWHLNQYRPSESVSMHAVTLILSAVEQGEPQAAEQLLALVYAELRRLAAQKLAQERPGQTLSATGLVHEAYLRLFSGNGEQQKWNNERHFFAAAAEAMRRVLIENARRKKRIKHGGERERVESDVASLPTRISSDELLCLDEALEKLTQQDPVKARLVALRY